MNVKETCNIVLNVPKDQLGKIKEFVYKYEPLEANSPYMELRCKSKDAFFTLFKTGKLVIQGKNEEKLEKIKDKIIKKISDGTESLILGIDETGRSELEGPFVITAMLGKNNELMETRDSKKTNKMEKSKEAVDKSALGHVSFVLNPKLIDKLRTEGITLNQIEVNFAEKMLELFETYNLDFETIFDGSALNSKVNKKIKFIEKADDTISTVSAASIISKTTRNESKNKDKRQTWNVKK
jgi:ribonuclease HII